MAPSSVTSESSASSASADTTTPPRNSNDTEVQDDEAKRLRSEVEDIISPYTDHSGEMLPFTADELAVMACLCLGPGFIGRGTIIFWLVTRFKDLLSKALTYSVRAQLEAKLDEAVEVGVPEDFVPGLRLAFEHFSTPLVSEDGGSVHWEGFNDMTVLPGPARLFLAKYLEPKRRGTFPFLKLPAEIRVTIYELLFTTPSKVLVDGVKDFAEFYVTGRWEETKPKGTWELSKDFADAFLLKTGDVSLQFLQTNKQIYREAMPLFYRLNSFQCLSTYATVELLTRTASHRQQHFTKLKLDLTDARQRALEGLDEALQALARIPALERLHLSIRDSDWLEMGPWERHALSRKHKFKTFKQVPGFPALAKACAKAKNLAVLGSRAEEFKMWLEEEMGELRKQEEKKKKKKLVKAELAKAKSSKKGGPGVAGKKRGREGEGKRGGDRAKGKKVRKA